MDTFFPSVVDLSDFHGMMNYYYQISTEKHNMSQYLWEMYHLFNDTNISEICRHDAILLEHEAENWTQLASYYSEFPKRGIFMTLPYGVFNIERMKEIIEKVIEIEDELIV